MHWSTLLRLDQAALVQFELFDKTFFHWACVSSTGTISARHDFRPTHHICCPIQRRLLDDPIAYERGEFYRRRDLCALGEHWVGKVEHLRISETNGMSVVSGRRLTGFLAR